jgi:transcription elongation factor Elf1
MVDHVDLKYAMMVSNRLERWKVKSQNPYRINFRCYECGDSTTDKNKARGWLLETRDHMSFTYFCHNCGASHSFRDFLKQVDQLTYNDYVTEKFIETQKSSTPREVVQVIEKNFESTGPVFDKSPLKSIKKVSQLAHDHPVKTYLTSRQIPTKTHYRIYYAPKFKKWINSVLPDKFDSLTNDEPRLILPFMDKKGNVFGVSARSFKPDGLRYITIMFDENRPKIFGYDACDFDKPYKVVEGGIDSLFLDNALAMAGADGNMNGLINTDNATIVFDNEPRNKDIHRRIEKQIANGYKVCIWPSYLKPKDINDMHLSGITDIDALIDENTYSGLAATLQLSDWRKT